MVETQVVLDVLKDLFQLGAGNLRLIAHGIADKILHARCGVSVSHFALRGVCPPGADTVLRAQGVAVEMHATSSWQL